MESLVELIGARFSKHHPSRARLYGQPAHGMEDVSDDGLEAWRTELASFEASLERAPIRSVGDSVLADEIRLFLRREHINYTLRRPYEGRATPYLNLCTLSLLNALYCRRSDNGGQLSVRLSRACDEMCRVLEPGETRLRGGTIHVTAREASWATSIIEGIRLAAQGQTVLSSSAITGLEAWTRPTSRTEQHSSANRTSASEYLSGVLGAETSLEELVEYVIRTLEQCLEYWNELADGRSAPMESVRIWRSETILDPKATAITEHVYALGRDAVGCGYMRHASVSLMPRFLQFMASDAIFLPGIDGSGIGRLLINGNTDGGECQSSTVLTPVLMMCVAHELCPGHALHLENGVQSEFKTIFQFTRSPLAFEGWAVHCESLVSQLCGDRNLARETLWHKIRRFRSAFHLVLPLVRKRMKARVDELSGNVLSAVPSMKDVCGSKDLSVLTYVVGQMEVERVLRLACSKYDIRAARLRFLRFGPISPKNAFRLIGAELTCPRERYQAKREFPQS